MHSLLFLPDISGFTKFVTDTDVAHGRHIVAELLELIIDSDRLGMTVSEIEGDAIFFIQRPASSFEEVLEQARTTFTAFRSHLRTYETRRICDCGACRTAHGLSLKMIAHRGPVETIAVHGFHKPYGPDVILAHRLLKNDVPDEEYLLVTPSLLAGDQDEGPVLDPALLPGWATMIDARTEYEDFGSVAYHYIPFGPLADGVPEPLPPPAFKRSEQPVVAETLIARSPAEVFGLVSDFDVRLHWSKGVQELRYEKERVNRVGTRHHCVVDGRLIEFETVTSEFEDGDLVYGEHVIDSPLVDDVVVYYVISPEGGGTRLRAELHYTPRAFPQSILAPLFRFGFGRRLPGVLKAIKTAAEGPTAVPTGAL